VIWLQIPTVPYWLGGGIISLSYGTYMGLMNLEIHTAQTLVPEPSAFGVEMAIEMLKRCKSTGNGQFPAELITADNTTIRSQIHKLIRPTWNKEELPGVNGVDHCTYL